MAGTKEGGAKAKASNLKRNPNFYKELGAKGGKKGKKDGAIKGFAHSHERAVEAGRKGGHNGKRGKAKLRTFTTYSESSDVSPNVTIAVPQVLPNMTIGSTPRRKNNFFNKIFRRSK